jgi:putative ABC transport system substrate-binding protein
MIGRRDFITLLGGAAAAPSLWPVAARAQQPTMPAIGFLNSASPEGYAPSLAAFRQALKESGYIEGQNVTIEYRWANGQYDRLPAMAAELVRRPVAVIVANSPGNQVVKTATTTIPIVFTTGTDPVQTGLVTSLNQPGGNVTGVTILGVELGPKRLELLYELVPAASLFAALVNPSDPARAETTVKGLQDAARALAVPIQIVHASSDQDLDAAFVSAARLQARGLVIGDEPFFNSRTEQLGALRISHGIPCIYQTREFAAAGGLASYGGSIPDAYRVAGLYAGRILKGEKPAELPVQQATKIELIINLKTAKALGITVPITLLGRADEVIE